MAQYSNIKKPAFYIPYMDYQQSLGNIKYKDQNAQILDSLFNK